MGRKAHPWYWEARKAWYLTVNGKTVKLAEDKKAAEQKFHQIMANPDQPAPAPKPGAQLAVVVIDQFLEWVKTHRSEGTYGWYRTVLEPFARKIKTLTVEELKPFHVEDWVQEEKAKKVPKDGKEVTVTYQWEPGTRRAAITAVKRCFAWAEKSGRIKESPVAHVERPEAGKREEIVTLEDYKAILRHVHDRPFRRLLRFAWETGARPQEIIALEPRHYDKANSRMVMPKEEAKGKKRPRIIYLSERARRIVERNLGDGRIFKNVDGAPFTKDAINCRFHRMQDKVGKKFCLYMWRHSWCHRALSSGMSPMTVAQLMGHANTSIIANVYGHLDHAVAHLGEQVNKVR